MQGRVSKHCSLDSQAQVIVVTSTVTYLTSSLLRYNYLGVSAKFKGNLLCQTFTSNRNPKVVQKGLLSHTMFLNTRTERVSQALTIRHRLRLFLRPKRSAISHLLLG